MAFEDPPGLGAGPPLSEPDNVDILVDLAVDKIRQDTPDEIFRFYLEKHITTIEQINQIRKRVEQNGINMSEDLEYRLDVHVHKLSKIARQIVKDEDAYMKLKAEDSARKLLKEEEIRMGTGFQQIRIPSDPDFEEDINKDPENEGDYGI